MDTAHLDALDLSTKGGFHADEAPALATIVTTTATTCITSAFGYSHDEAVEEQLEVDEGASVAEMIAAREAAVG